MKTIFRILMILVVASAVAGVFYLVVNNISNASSASENGQPPAMTSADGQSFQTMERPQGGLITQGFFGVFVTMLKLTGITLFLLSLQKAFNGLGALKKKLRPA